MMINDRLEYSLVLKSNLEVKAKGSIHSSIEGMPLPTSKFDTKSIYSVNIDFMSKVAIILTTDDLFVQLMNTRIMIRLRPGDGLSGAIEDTKIRLMDQDVQQSSDFYSFIALHNQSLDFVKCDLNPSLSKYTSKSINFSIPIVDAALFSVYLSNLGLVSGGDSRQYSACEVYCRLTSS